jgi:hypothetical protein
MNLQLTQKQKSVIFHLFDSEVRLKDFLFEPFGPPRLREKPEILLEDCWELPQEQQILVRAALDIWNGSGNVFLWELLRGLNEKNFGRLIFVLHRLRNQDATRRQNSK